MEYYQNRIDSFGPVKSKRTKASSSKPVWPHPPSFKATPKTLAEAGFYFHPDSDNNDNAACFTCGKNLAGWEPDDDPFTIHYQKCRDKCAWALVRCQRALGDGSFDFSDPTRHPTSKAMEKARLETFSKARWPHDAVKGHGANSKAMAKAGFLCIPTEAGDDTSLCLYCELSLSGWDDDDDPYEEHVKRDKKKQTSCPFIKACAGNSLSKSTAKRPASKAATKPPTQSSRAVTAKGVVEKVEVSDDELAALSPLSEVSVPTTTSRGRASKASSARASSVAKTPASRRSTRGTSTTGKTPGSRTVSSEVEETDAGSESDTGRRMTKSKRKTGRQTKARVSAIAEEEGEAESSRPTQEAVEDVEMDDVPVPEPDKKKRGRPPKSATAKPATKGKPKKAEVKVEDEEEVEVDTEPPPAPPAKKSHARTRSKANLESDAEVAAPSKGTHKRTKSTSKTKVKRDEDEDEVPVVLAPASKRKGKQRAKEDEEDPPSAPPAMPKGRAISRSKHEGSEDEDIVPAAEDLSHNRANGVRSSTSGESNVASERKSSLSDDAGYATAEAHLEVDRMEVDDEPAPPPPKPTRKTQPPPSKAPQPPPRANSRSTPSGSDGSQRPSPVINGVRSSSAAPPSSCTSSSRPPSKLSVARMSTKDSLKVIEIDSDGDGSPERPTKSQPKTKLPVSRAESTVSVNGVTKPTGQAPKKKLQVEVVMPPKAPKLANSDDVQMRDERPARPPPRPPRSPSRPTRPEPDIPVPGTPVSAVHRSAHPSPERDAGREEDAPMERDADAIPAAPTSPSTYHPFLAQFPIEKLVSLTEEETEMTLEQYIRREMELQYVQVKADGERRIEEFKQKAAETRKLIETS
ncbi:hypothetical protein LXA43DRAFT_10498 [Ganoderma leucocontextum]|nr:hypothetical protein LXA43DRAFT_10498 [Ganoderma leucocontextum]